MNMYMYSKYMYEIYVSNTLYVYAYIYILYMQTYLYAFAKLFQPERHPNPNKSRNGVSGGEESCSQSAFRLRVVFCPLVSGSRI